MLTFLSRKKRMPGGLHFGPPAWHPTQIESSPSSSTDSPTAQLPITNYPLPTLPDSLPSLITLLEKLQLHRTSAIIPGLLEQLQPAATRPIHTLILNLLPTQPEFALPAALTRLALPQITLALQLLHQILQPRRTLIVLDRHDLRSRRLWRRQQKASKKSPAALAFPFKIKSLPNQYPQAHPTPLIGRLSGKRLPVGRLPTRLNFLLLDPVTCYILGQHLQTGQPFTHRPVQLFTQSGAGAKDPSARLVLAPLGETVDAACRRFGITTDHHQVILNGMLAGEQIDPLATTIQSHTESISLRELPAAEPATPCFSCGWCVDICPTSLNPVNLLQLAEEAQHAAAPDTPSLRSSHAREALHCIGCGLCSYVCPTRLPLTQQTLRLRSYVENTPSAKDR